MKSAKYAALALLVPGLAWGQTYPSPVLKLDQSTVTATGGTTARSLADRAADVVNVKDFGLICDGNSANSTTNAANFQVAWDKAAASTYGATIYVPSGRCYMNATITETIANNTSITLRGEGQEVSELVWTNSGDGIDVTLSGNGYWIRQNAAGLYGPSVAIKGVSLVADGSARLAGTALSIIGDVVNGRPSPYTLLDDISVRSGTNNANWNNGIKLTNVPQVFMDRLSITWGGAPGANAAISILGTGSLSPTQYSLSNSSILGGVTYGIYFDGAVQGFYGSNNSIIADNGVYWTGVGNQDNFQWVNNYIMGSVYGIYNPPSQSIISGNLFNDRGSSSPTAIYFTSGGVVVKSNTLQLGATSNTAISDQTNYTVVNLNQSNTISDNAIFGAAIGITLGTNTQNQLVFGNTLGRADATFNNLIVDSGTNNHVVNNNIGQHFVAGPIVGPFQMQVPDSTTAGGNTRAADAVDFQKSRTSASQVASGASSVIAGGVNNTASGIGSYAAGVSNIASAAQAVALGNANNATASQAFAMGFLTIADGVRSRAGGSYAVVRGRYGADCWGSGKIAIQGDAEVCLQPLTGTGATASAIRLTADNAAAGGANCINIPDKTLYTLKITISALDHTTPTNNETWNEWTGKISRGTGVATTAVAMNSTPTPLTSGTVTGSAIAATADTTNGCLNVSFTPPTSNTDTWNVVARVETVEVQ